MSALLLGTKANYLTHESYTVETEDHEDHTFNGVMFDVFVKSERPVERVVVDAIHVRGGLGRLTVWYAKGGHVGREEDRRSWTLCHESTREPSWRQTAELRLTPPAALEPDTLYGFYVHCAEVGDDGIVYDNQRAEVVHEDAFVDIFPGLAHLSPEPFSGRGPWWGSPWRRRRQFVGKLDYGARYTLWGPKAHTAFSSTFKNGVAAAFFALAVGWRGLPTDCVLYILHLARYDWYDTPETIAAAEAAEAKRARVAALLAADTDASGDDGGGDESSSYEEAASDFEDEELTPEDAEHLAAIHLEAVQRRYETNYDRFDNIADSDDDAEMA